MRFPHRAQAFLRSKIFFAALASLVVLGVALVAALTWFKAERLQDLRISTSTRGGTYLTVGEGSPGCSRSTPTGLSGASRRSLATVRSKT